MVFLVTLDADAGPIFDANEGTVNDADCHQRNDDVTKRFQRYMHDHSLNLNWTCGGAERRASRTILRRMTVLGEADLRPRPR